LPTPTRLAKSLRDNFFGPNELSPPKEPALQPHYDAAIFLGKISGFVVKHAMYGPIHGFARLDFVDFKSVEDLGKRMNCVLQIIAPGRDVNPLTLLFRSVSQLGG
jgi:hypothetical protein